MISIIIIFSALIFSSIDIADSATVVNKSTIVFVCEHGSAKSVVAAAYFNHLAKQQGLQFHAIPRGTTPDAELSPKVVKALHNDQINLPPDKPRKLTYAEASNALWVITFCELPHDIKTQNVDRWDVPPISEDYSKSRDAILKKLQELIQRLKNNGATK